MLISVVALVGLFLSNVAYDRQLPHYLSRKIGHLFGGVAYLMCYALYDSGVYPLALSMLFSLVLLAANLRRPQTFRGVGGSGRATRAISEAAFPLSAVPVIAVGWIVMGLPAVVLAALLFMAFGDMVTGIVRSKVYGKAVKGWAGTWAMGSVCIIIAVILVDPIWAGIAGAIMATLVEHECGDVGRIRWLDDNFAIPVAAAAVMLPLVEVVG